MANEAEVIVNNDASTDDKQLDNNNQPENQAGGGSDDKSENKNPDENKESLRLAEERTKKLEEGWREDRDYYQSEIKRLRVEANHPEYTAKEEEELEGLEGVERDRKVVEFHKKREDLASKAELEAVKSEVRFYERTSQEFADNKKDILKVAQDYDCPTLKQAILVWRGLNIDKANKDANYNDKRKKDADGKSGGNAGGKTDTKPYDSKTDGKKSFGDLYRESGVK